MARMQSWLAVLTLTAVTFASGFEITASG